MTKKESKSIEDRVSSIIDAVITSSLGLLIIFPFAILGIGIIRGIYKYITE